MAGALSRVPGLAGFLEAGQLGQQEQLGQLQQLGAVQGILGRAQQQKQQAAALQQEQEMRGILSRVAQETGGDPAKMVPALLQTGMPQAIQLAGNMRGLMPTRPQDNIAKLNPRDFTPDSWAAYVQGGDTTKLRPTPTQNAILNNDMQRQQLQTKLFMWQNLSPAQRTDVLRDIAKFNLDAQKFTFETGLQVPPLSIPPEAAGGAPQLPAGLPGVAPQGAQTPAQFPRGAAAGENPQLQMRILQSELAQTQDPTLRASLEREIARVGGGQVPAPQAAPQPSAPPAAPIPGGDADRQLPQVSPKQRQEIEGEYRKVAAKGAYERDAGQYESATNAVENIAKLDTIIDHLKNSQTITGIGSELLKDVNRLKVFVSQNKAAGKKVSDTELLNAFLGSDVFPMIKALGIGARGLDTPAEREFLREVMSGTINMNKDTLIRLTEFRRNIAERAIKKFNERVQKGEMDRFFDASGIEKAIINTGISSSGNSGGFRVIR